MSLEVFSFTGAISVPLAQSNHFSTPPIRFEDSPSSGMPIVYSSHDFEEIYKLMQRTNDTISEERILKKFEERPGFSARHFKIIWSSNSEKTTFCHLACFYGAEKVVDWFIKQFPNLSPFDINDKTESTSPLTFMINTALDNEIHARIAGKLLTASPYEIYNETISNQSAPKTHRVIRNGKTVDGLSIPILQASTLSKPLILGEILESYTKRERTILHSSILSQIMPVPLISIIHEYSSSIRDVAALTISTVGGFFATPLECVLTPLHNLCNNKALNPVLIKNMIKTVKLLLNCNDSLYDFPYRVVNHSSTSIRMHFEKLFPANFLELLKTENEDHLYNLLDSAVKLKQEALFAYNFS